MARISIAVMVTFISTTLSAQQTQKQDTLQSMSDTKITVTEMLAKLPGPKGERYATGMKHGTMEVFIYAPKGNDPQTPHSRDEVYIVFSGSGIFFDGNQRYSFKAGDVLFVPANTEHKFEEFTDDFVTWVVFYGKVGGEN
jgi:mannose-6-phosphate isomerase-like protein (cupin superfamily)